MVRIPLRSAKHHFGVAAARGTRESNEDTYQAGVIELPAFAKRPPLSVTIGGNRDESNGTAHGGVEGGEGGAGGVPGAAVASSGTGDPQVFYFGIFDGHGGTECSEFLRDQLHEYIQDAAVAFELESSLKQRVIVGTATGHYHTMQERKNATGGQIDPSLGVLPLVQGANRQKMAELERTLLSDWKDLVGGYFRRFRPVNFSYSQYGESTAKGKYADEKGLISGATMEEVMEYAFLKADYDFVTAQVRKRTHEERPLNEEDILHSPSQIRTPKIGGPKCFKGGSTSSVAMISTPSPTPFWHPSASASLLVSHVGDTRILLCSTATGLPIPLTLDHRPSSPVEGNRLRRYAASFVTDSFGEERIDGLANTRAFGDIHSKRSGVSAEPETRRIELKPAEYSFLVLVSDGVSGTLPDQEVVDIVKEARTPDQGARDVVSFATEVSKDGDNATCLVVRLGGWERRQEGGLGSIATKEQRVWRVQEASNPRSRRR